jgi:hypothetical protein
MRIPSRITSSRIIFKPHRINHDPNQAGEYLPQLARRGKNRRSFPMRAAFQGQARSDQARAKKLLNRFQSRRNFGQYPVAKARDRTAKVCLVNSVTRASSCSASATASATATATHAAAWQEAFG